MFSPSVIISTEDTKYINFFVFVLQKLNLHIFLKHSISLKVYVSNMSVLKHFLASLCAWQNSHYQIVQK